MTGIWVGVLRVALHIPHARTLKDGRQVCQRIRDRVRSRFEVTCHEVEASDHPTRRVLVVTTAGGDAQTVRSVLDRVRALMSSDGDSFPQAVDVDVYHWHPPGLTGLVSPDDQDRPMEE